ncbi:MAG: TraR/DksA family transcriptional regulator [Alphaproteobacteria bacterium]
MARSSTRSKTADLSSVTAEVTEPVYSPSSTEEYMNPRMQDYFRSKLLAERKALDEDIKRAGLRIQESEGGHVPDMADAGANITVTETDSSIRRRGLNKIRIIDAALKRMEDGEYGFCEDTGEPIGVDRLDANPSARRTLEAQERHERAERMTGHKLPERVVRTRARAPSPS